MVPYAVMALLWLVPDQRVERALDRGGSAASTSQVLTIGQDDPSDRVTRQTGAASSADVTWADEGGFHQRPRPSAPHRGLQIRRGPEGQHIELNREVLDASSLS
jgi:hypothetical protein